MEIISVDRTSENHGLFRSTVQLTYDEIVLISNALYLSLKTDEISDRKEEYEKLHRDWRAFECISCHGDVGRLDIKD